LGGLVSVVVYALAVAADDIHSKAAALIGGPALMLTFLTAYLTARRLNARARLRLLLRFSFSSGLSPWVPVWVGIGIDAWLIVLVILDRKLVLQ
jgi:hypothetical protein